MPSFKQQISCSLSVRVSKFESPILFLCWLVFLISANSSEETVPSIKYSPSETAFNALISLSAVEDLIT